MPDTTRTRDYLLNNSFADNSNGLIGANDLRDLVASIPFDIDGNAVTVLGSAATYDDTDYERTNMKNAANGYAGLDSNGDVVGVFIPRLGTVAEINAIVLESGEFAYCTDTKELRIGDGTTAGGSFLSFISATTSTIGGYGFQFGQNNTISALNCKLYPILGFDDAYGEDEDNVFFIAGDQTLTLPQGTLIVVISPTNVRTDFSSTAAPIYDAVNDRTIIQANDTIVSDYSYLAAIDQLPYNFACGVLNSVSKGSFTHGIANESSDLCSFTSGMLNKAQSICCHAEGLKTTASGENSHAEGEQTTASGDWSHAEGYRTTASSSRDHAEGDTTTASGSNSHAEGKSTTASGGASHAEGNSTTASASGAHAQGSYSLANKRYQDALASGRFSVTGDCQYTNIVMRVATTNATPTQLTLTGLSPSGTVENLANRFICATNKSYSCFIQIAARKSDGTSAYFIRQVIIKNVSGTVSLEGSVQTVGVDINPGAWTSPTIAADDTNKALTITVTGVSATNIRWGANIQAMEITY
ncbi:MAG: hypothetical protein M0R80_00630 [Proteobacteria bacterium]|jgi:hypothetical protein|nr:hypothetical protein [Pseudomonadota bacterium]